MKKSIKAGNAIKVQGIGQMIKNKFTRSQAIYRNYPNGIQTVIFDGEEYPKTEFEKMYPINLRPKEPKGKNPDRRGEWMHS